MAAIEAQGLTKVFGRLVAVDHVSFTVKEAEIFGFLGPNGSGKTTTINMLTTLMTPTEGTARVGGHEVVREAEGVRSAIGLVPQDLTVDEDLTGLENMLLQAKLYHVPEGETRKRIPELLELVGLADAADRRVETYSGGMRKRLELVEGLIHYPKVLFLDEPTLGLDVQTRTMMWRYIKSLRDEHNITIFLTTHYMEEADILCDRVAIIDRGRIRALDTPSNLKDGLGGDVVELTLADGSPDIGQELLSLPLVKSIKRVDDAYRIKVERGEEALPMLMERIVRMSLRANRVALTKPTLDQVYLEYTGRSLRDEEKASEEETWRRMWTMRRLRA